jgi:hypothetical protein
MTRHLRAGGIAGWGVAAVLACGAAWAETFPVDDSRSQVLDSNVRMQWESLAPGRGRSNLVVGQTTVIVRLDVEPWQGRRGRIFMLLPARAEAPVEARWTTRGPLQPGTLRSGERATVFAGPINGALIEDTLVLRITIDGDSLERDESLEFRFEIEVEP